MVKQMCFWGSLGPPEGRGPILPLVSPGPFFIFKKIGIIGAHPYTKRKPAGTPQMPRASDSQIPTNHDWRRMYECTSIRLLYKVAPIWSITKAQ